MKRMMDSIGAVVQAHNEMEKHASGLVDLFNDVMAEHCDFYDKVHCSMSSCTHNENELNTCCMAHCPLGS